jgi:hypothetical protein
MKPAQDLLSARVFRTEECAEVSQFRCAADNCFIVSVQGDTRDA